MAQPSLKKNYIYRVVYDIFSLVAPFITTPYVARVLGAEGVGTYSYVFSIVSYFMIFAALGTITYGTREIAQHRDNKQDASKLFWEIETMTIITSSVCFVIFIVMAFFVPNYKYYFFAVSPFILATMFDISWFFTGYEKIKNIVLRNLACRIIGIVLLFVCVRTKDDLITYMLINSLVQLVGSLSMWAYLPKLLKKIKPTELKLAKHFKNTITYFLPTVATSIYSILDKTLIGLITRDSAQNGYYEQASKMIIILETIVFISINSIMSARMSYLFAEKKTEEVKEKLSNSINFVFLLGCGCLFGIVAIARIFVPIFFGPGYDPVVLLLYMMAPLVLIVGISFCLANQYFIPNGQIKKTTQFIVTGAIVNLVLNIAFIPKFGMYGATVATIISEILITILYLKYCNKYVRLKQLARFLYKRIIAGLIMFGCVYTIGRVLIIYYAILVSIQVVVGVIVYLGILLLWRDDMLLSLIDKAKESIGNWRRRKQNV